MLELFDLPHDRARALLDRGVPVFLTVNPVEYHGPHLSLHNDRLISLGLARDIHAALSRRWTDWPFVVATDIEGGVGPTPGMGTRVQSFQTVSRLVIATCRALRELGALRVVILTFHGDPLHNRAIAHGVQWLADHECVAVAPFNVLMHDMLDFSRHFDLERPPLSDAFDCIEDAHERRRVKEAMPYDFHAGFFETSIALHYAPESVSRAYRRVPPCPSFRPHRGWGLSASLARGIGRTRLAKWARIDEKATKLAAELEFTAEAYGWHTLAPFPGYTSRPHLASARSGSVFAEGLVRRFAEEVELVFRGQKEPTPPALAWAAPLSFGGRVGQLSPALRETVPWSYEGEEAPPVATEPAGLRP
jgi:creatinine amidohydrolase